MGETPRRMKTKPSPEQMKPLAPGFYYVGYITAASHSTMPDDAMKKRWPIGTPMSNTKPHRKESKAKAEARRHALRDVTVQEIK